MTPATGDRRRDPEPARAPHRGADRRAREGVRRDPRRRLLRPRRARPPLHHRDDRVPPPPRGDVARGAARRRLQARVGARDRHQLGREDPREHGDRPQRHARPVGLDERSPDPLLHLGLGHGLDRRGVEALPQLRPPHLHEHPRQGQGPRLRDHADRPEPEVASGLPLPAALQPGADGALRVGRRLPRHGPRGPSRGREVARRT